MHDVAPFGEIYSFDRFMEMDGNDGKILLKCAN